MARHNAYHKAISKADWLASQQRQLQAWLEPSILEKQRKQLHDRYFTCIQPWLAKLDSESEIAEIGSGPVCFSQEITVGHKTFIDPLLDDFRRIYPGAMPKGAVYINRAAESIPLPSHCVDLILCMNVLSFALNPEEVMHEISRLLKPDGTLLLAVQVSAPWLARLHYAAHRLLPILHDHLRPYRFCQRAIEHTIARHLVIHECLSIVRHHPLNLLADNEVLFVCSPHPDD